MNTSLTQEGGSSARLVVQAGRHTATAPADQLLPAAVEFARILVPIDFSVHSLKALDYAVKLGHTFGSGLILVHVVEQPVYPADWMFPMTAATDQQNRETLLRELKALTKDQDIPTQAFVRLLPAWRGIVELAQEMKADLIVIATHGHTGLMHALLGSVAEKVVRHAPCPVLTLRAEAKDLR